MKNKDDVNSYFKDPRSKSLEYLIAENEKGHPIVGLYCSFSPKELVYAMGGVPVGLCATSNKPIAASEEVLPTNLCPLIKASFGFIKTGTCPFFDLSDAIVGETTCDGKKKMFELIKDKKPTHILELPQMPDEKAAFYHWKAEIETLKVFLENQFDTRITKEKLNESIKLVNHRRKLVMRLYEFGKISPPVVSGTEMNRMLDFMACGDEYDSYIGKMIEKLERRRDKKQFATSEEAPRVLVTGCPVAGDAAKVLEIIEELGGVIVVHDSCSGIKPVYLMVEEDTDDPIESIARRYFNIPCSCMTPNTRRLTLLEELIQDYKPDVVIDVILQACHTYNIESYTIREHVKRKYGLPFLKIETDYSPHDRGQIKTRVEATLEMAEKREMRRNEEK